MNEILSNDEIDTLLEMFRAEGASLATPDSAAAPASQPTPGVGMVSAIDLLKPNRLSREHLRGLERYFGSAAKQLSAVISDKLRLDTRCDCVAVEQMRFQTWIDHLPGPTAIYVLQLQPFPMPVLFTATTSLLYGAVDRILGGSGRVNRVPKDFTQAEYTVADALIGPCLDRICESLQDVVKLDWSIQSRFCNPAMAHLLASQDVVLSVYFQAAGDFLIGDLRMVIPFTCMEPYVERLGQDVIRWQEPGTMRETVTRTVSAVPLDLSVMLGSSRIRLRQLLDLQPGDVVPLTTRLGEAAVIPIQGKPKLRGYIGRIGNRLAVQVADVVATDR